MIDHRCYRRAGCVHLIEDWLQLSLKCRSPFANVFKMRELFGEVRFKHIRLESRVAYRADFPVIELQCGFQQCLPRQAIQAIGILAKLCSAIVRCFASGLKGIGFQCFKCLTQRLEVLSCLTLWYASGRTGCGRCKPIFDRGIGFQVGQRREAK